MQETPAPRIDAVAMHKDAVAYVDAAQRLMRRNDGTVDTMATTTPIYFLICQSIELTLKAYLRLKGFDDGALRKIGHGLIACLNAAESNGLNVTAEFEEIVQGLDQAHASHIFRYQRECWISVPRAWPASEIVAQQAQAIGKLIRSVIVPFIQAGHSGSP